MDYHLCAQRKILFRQNIEITASQASLLMRMMTKRQREMIGLFQRSNKSEEKLSAVCVARRARTNIYLSLHNPQSPSNESSGPLLYI
jgi:hypothetical protein